MAAAPGAPPRPPERVAVEDPPRRRREAGVPVHRDPELADALAALALGDEVPETLWTAVAEVLAWAYSL